MECASVQRDASSIAWCPVQNTSSINIGYNKTYSPLYLLASVHQDMDTSFNSTSQIEILNTSPSAINNRNNTIPSLGNCVSKLNFTTLTWGQQTKPTEQSPLGLIAGGMQDGSVTFWNPYNLIKGSKTKSLIGQYDKYHQQKITAMQFNPTVTQHTFLATADEGEKLYVWDLTNPSKPVAQQPPGGSSASRSTHAYKAPTAVAWNNNVSYILAVSNCLGQTQIFDLRNKKVALTFESKNIDKAQSISWNPNKARQLAVCYAKGIEAEIWDLRKPKTPKMYLRDEQYGHTRPITDLSWSCVDSNLLLTSGEDGIGNIWDGNKGKFIYQISFGNDPKEQIEWNNLRGGMLAAMSTRDISIYNINYLGEYCPTWLNKDCGVTMGFGGKVISFGKDYIISASTSSTNLRVSSSQTPKTKKKLKIPPTINIDYLPKSQSMIARAEQFKKTLNSLSTPDDLRNFTETKLKTLNSMKLKIGAMASSVKTKAVKSKKDKDDEYDLAELLGTDSEEEEEEEEMVEEELKQDEESKGISGKEIDYEITIWEMIRLFFNEQDCKDDIIQYLGFEKKELMRKQREIEEREKAQILQEQQQEEASKEQQQKELETKPDLSVNTGVNKQSTGLFGDSDVDDGGFDIGAMGQDDDEEEESDVDDEDFFNTLGSNKPTKIIKQESPKPIKQEEKQEVKEKKVDDTKDESSTEQAIKGKIIEKRFEMPSKVDKEVRSALITGNYRLAIDLSLNAGNIADALVFAYYGQDEDKQLWDIVSKSYFNQHSQQFISNTFKYIASNDYIQLVQNSDLTKWKQTLAILLTFTEGRQFNDLCNSLGQRILETSDNLQGAIACFLCSHNISQLISIWTINNTDSNNKQQNKKPADLILHSCITKALIYVNAPFVQKSLSTSPSSYTSGQAALSSIFCKYANLLANQGSLQTASTFLQFVDTKLKGPRGANNKNPQIIQLIDRITSSQKSGPAPQQQTRQQRTSNPEEWPSSRQPKPINTRGGMGGRGSRPIRPGVGGRGRRRPSSPKQSPTSLPTHQPQPQPQPTRPTRPTRGPTRGRPPSRGGMGGRGPPPMQQPRGTTTSPKATAPGPGPSMRGRGRGRDTRRGRGGGSRGGRSMPTSQARSPISSTNPPIRTTQPNPNVYGSLDDDISPRSSSGGGGMPPSRATRGRGGPRTRSSTRPVRSRGGGRGPPPTTAPTQQQQPPRQLQQQPTGGMNGTSMPPRSRGGAGGSRGRGAGSGSSRGRGMPPTGPPVSRGRGGNRPSTRGPSRGMPPTSSQPQQQQQRPSTATSMPPRSGGRDMRSRGGRSTRGSSRGRPPQRGRPGGRPNLSRPVAQQQQEPVEAMGGYNDAQEVIEKPVGNNKVMKPGGYSASAASSGSGYFGQTSLLQDDTEKPPLPDTATETLSNIESYLSNIMEDSNIMNTLSVTQTKTLKTQSIKLEKDLNDLIGNNKMSYFAYSTLLSIFNSLSSRQYDQAMKSIQDFTKSCKSNKQEKFATHRKWVMAFQSIIRIAKQYNI